MSKEDLFQLLTRNDPVCSFIFVFLFVEFNDDDPKDSRLFQKLSSLKFHSIKKLMRILDGEIKNDQINKKHYNNPKVDKQHFFAL